MSIHKHAFRSPPSWLRQISAKGRRVGIITPGYGLEKVSYGLQPSGVTFSKVNRIPLHRFTGNDNAISQCPIVVGGPVDLVHTFNMIPLNKSFVVSYETELPRFLSDPSERHLQFGYELLQSERCKGIYALSIAGQRFAQRRMVERGLTELANEVGVFRGGVDRPEGTVDSRPTHGPIRACFVGGHMFHKGIEATIQALKLLRDGGVNIELTAVGSAAPTTFAAPGLLFDKSSLMRELEERSWVTHHLHLPNDKVIEVFNKSHLLIFPSIDESLGWVLVEAGLSGLPRLATNIFAFPELIRPSIDGWMINLPLNDDSRWLHLGQSSAIDGWHEAKTQIADSIVRILGDSSMSLDRLIEMGHSAKENMSQLYSVPKARAQLQGIYQI